MNARAVLFYSGLGLIAVGSGLPLILPSLPGSVQSNPTLAPVGSFVINNQNWISLGGAVLIVVSLFV